MYHFGTILTNVFTLYEPGDDRDFYKKSKMKMDLKKVDKAFKNVEFQSFDCLPYCQYLEMKISVWDWQFLSFLRGGKPNLANQVLEKVPKVTGLMENDNYYQRLQFYKGELPVKQMIDFSQPLPTEQINMAYGMSCLEDNKEKANQIRKNILETNQWISFSFLAAEADISRKANK
jgi:hypothetical protein